MTKPTEHRGRPIWREYFCFDIQQDHELYIEFRNRNIIAVDEYLCGGTINCNDMTGATPSELWIDLMNDTKGATNIIGRLRCKLLVRQKNG